MSRSLFAPRFADFIMRLEKRLGGEPSDGLRLASLLLADLSARGHVCVELSKAAGKSVGESTGGEPGGEALPGWAAWKKALGSCRTVGRPGGEVTPLVLDKAGRLYLHRLWSDEALVASRVKELAAAGRFSIVTGGPGTGKTTRAAGLLAEFAASPPCVPSLGAAALAAPTGKAAARLSEAVEQAVGRLALPDEVRERIPQKAQTLHRLMGWSPGRGRFRHGPDDPLPYGLVVVDEASMAPLPLLARLLEALPPGARLVLLGDRHQLASVEAGAVLADLCAGAEEQEATGAADAKGRRKRSPLAGAVTVLTKNWRYSEDSGIARAAAAINHGRADEALALLREGSPDIGWRTIAGEAELAKALDSASERFLPFCAAATPDEALDAINRFRILAAVREGAWGVRSLNAAVTASLAAKGLVDLSPLSGGEWHHRRPLLVTVNDYGLGLFNGDIGVAWRGEDGETRVWFRVEGALRGFRPTQLPFHETAFAMTVHKSQGSEFESVVFVLPDRDSPVLTRELAYTAVTRAKADGDKPGTGRVEVWGRETIFRAAVARPTERPSGLRDALWGEAG
jgi:exodeoxyribonuclease V alpha subunit